MLRLTMRWRLIIYRLGDPTRKGLRASRACPTCSPPAMSCSSRGLGHRPLTAVTGVRIPYGTPVLLSSRMPLSDRVLRALKPWLPHRRLTVSPRVRGGNTDTADAGQESTLPAAAGELLAGVQPSAQVDQQTWRQSESRQGPFRGALVGAGLSFFVGVVLSLWSSYATRLDQHAQEAERCTSLVSSLIVTPRLILENVVSAKNVLQAPVPPSRLGNPFVLPPIDEVLRAELVDPGLLDPTTLDSTLRLTVYYRSIRDDLSATPTVIHDGETFAVIYPGDKQVYVKAMDLLAAQSHVLNELLARSHRCESFGRTSFFWPRARKIAPEVFARVH